jgi:lysophospholipase L1-like esterase
MTTSQRRLLAATILALAANANAQAQTPAQTPAKASPGQLAIYDGRPLAGGQVTLAGSDTSEVLAGDAVMLAPATKVPGSRAAVQQAAGPKAAGALSLQWTNAWTAALRVDAGQPLDLRPYIDQGVLAFDLNVEDLGKGGIAFKVSCGDQCERQVSYVVPGRAIEGKGWRHVAFPLRCFVRDGDDFSRVARPFALDGTGSGRVAVANIRFLKTGTGTDACPDYKTVSVTPEKLNESWAIEWWTPRHEKKVRDAQALGAKAQVVFIGDSITEGWENAGAPVWARNYKPLDGLVLGFGGDRTENVLWRVTHGEVDGIAPKVAVLMFGTNNTGHRQENPATTAAGIKRNIEELRRRLPDTKILLLAIFPRGEKADDPLRLINQKVNAIIAGFADNQNVYFLDIGKEFLTADGTLSKDIMPDLLHPNEKGYEIWARAMAPQLSRLLPASKSSAAP